MLIGPRIKNKIQRKSLKSLQPLGIKMKKKKQKKIVWSTRDNLNVKHDKVVPTLLDTHSAYQELWYNETRVLRVLGDLAWISSETRDSEGCKLIVNYRNYLECVRSLLHGHLYVIEWSNWEALSLSALSMNVLFAGRV